MRTFNVNQNDQFQTTEKPTFKVHLASSDDESSDFKRIDTQNSDESSLHIQPGYMTH